MPAVRAAICYNAVRLDTLSEFSESSLKTGDLEWEQGQIAISCSKPYLPSLVLVSLPETVVLEDMDQLVGDARACYFSKLKCLHEFIN